MAGPECGGARGPSVGGSSDGARRDVHGGGRSSQRGEPGSLVPVFGIVLGGTMTAVASRRALDALDLRAGEVEAALFLVLSERDSRMEVIERPLSDALLPNLDQARTAGLVTLPGAFVGVLLATGSTA